MPRLAALLVAVLPSILASRAAAAPSTPAQVCALLTDADVKAVLGKPAQARPGGLDLTGPSCAWKGDNAGMEVAVETDASLAAASSNAKGETIEQRFKMMLDEVAAKRATSVTGVGEQAVWQSNLLWVRAKGALLKVSINRKGYFPADDLPGARLLATKALARL